MNSKLQEVNKIFLQCQLFIDPTVEELERYHSFAEREPTNYTEEMSHALKLYNQGINKLNEILPTLSSKAIEEGYLEGCRLLQRGLSGYMGHNFNSSFIPIMKKAILDAHRHTAWVFLQTLTNQLGLEAEPIVITALDSVSADIRAMALQIVEQRQLISAASCVQAMTQDPDAEIAVHAKEVLKKLVKPPAGRQ